MKLYWSNNKETLVAAEEGKIAAKLEQVQKNGACKKLMQLVQFILVTEIAFFLGWACYSFYQSKNVASTNVEDDHLKLNSVSALHNNFKLNPEQPNESKYIKWQEKSSEHKAFDPSSSSEPWSAKTQIVENPDSSKERDSVLLNTKDSVNHPRLSSSLDVTIPSEIETSTYKNYRQTTEDFEEKEIKNVEDKKTEEAEEFATENLLLKIATESFLKSGIEEMTTTTETETAAKNTDEIFVPPFIQKLHDLDRAEAKAKEQISTSDIMAPREGTFKRYHFQISLGPETGIEDSDQDSQNSEEVSEERPAFPFFVHVFFNVSDSEENSSASDNIGNTIDPVYPSFHPETTFSEVDPGIYRSFWNIEAPIFQDEEDSLNWWVNIPAFQNTREGGLNIEEESQKENSNVASVFDNDVSSDKNIFDFPFGKSDSLSIIVPELEEVENKKSIEVVKSKPGSLDEALADLVSPIFSLEENNHSLENEDPLIGMIMSHKSSAKILDHELEDIMNQLKADIEEESIKRSTMNKTVDLLHDHVFLDRQMNSAESKDEVPKKIIPDKETASTEEKVRKEYEDLLKTLTKIQFPAEDHEISGTHTESHLYQEESMVEKEEMVSEEEPEGKLPWEDEENWFHSQSTWKEESEPEKYLQDLFQNIEPQNYEYDEPLNFDSTEYLYED